MHSLKTAQISIFVLLGAVILLVFGAVLLLLSSSSSSSYESSSSSPQNFVDVCYKKASACALAENSRLSLPLPALDSFLQTVSDDTKDKAVACFNNFEDFKGMAITATDVTPSFEAHDDTVSVQVTHTIQQSENGNTKSLRDYHAQLPIRLKKIAALPHHLPPAGYIKLSDGVHGVDVSVCNGILSPVIVYRDSAAEAEGVPYQMIVNMP